MISKDQLNELTDLIDNTNTYIGIVILVCIVSFGLGSLIGFLITL